jgi:hypothetical protein
MGSLTRGSVEIVPFPTRGVYVRPDHATTRHTDVAAVAARSPKAIVCLVSAPTLPSRRSETASASGRRRRPTFSRWPRSIGWPASYAPTSRRSHDWALESLRPPRSLKACGCTPSSTGSPTTTARSLGRSPKHSLAATADPATRSRFRHSEFPHEAVKPAASGQADCHTRLINTTVTRFRRPGAGPGCDATGLRTAALRRSPDSRSWLPAVGGSVPDRQSGQPPLEHSPARKGSTGFPCVGRCLRHRQCGEADRNTQPIERDRPDSPCRRHGATGDTPGCRDIPNPEFWYTHVHDTNSRSGYR